MNDLLPALRQMPFGRLLIAFVTGILIQHTFYFSAGVLIAAAIILIVVWIVLFLLPVSYRFGVRWLQGVVILGTLLVLGAAAVFMHLVQHNRSWLGHQYRQGVPLLILVTEPAVSRPASWRVATEVQAMAVDGKWLPVTGKLLVYFQKDSTPPPAPGTELITNKALQAVSSFRNPGGFDYAAYCARQQIFHQVYLRSTDYRIAGMQELTAYTRLLAKARQAVLDNIHRYIPDRQTAGVAAALLIGYRDELDRELLTAYAAAGVVHVIAISGMHLAMIYGLLCVVMRRLKQHRQLRWLHVTVILLVLWLFTGLAGAVPSISRSAVMFSVIVLGEAFYKRHHSLNNLAASAFILLVYNPLYLWDVGFQLSYTAVAGVMLFYQPLYYRIVWQNRILDYIWQLTALTLAAQVFALPVVLFHFHQFPVFFILSNLFIVPLSGIALYVEMAMLLLAWCPPLALLAGKLVMGCIVAMNAVVKQITAMPVATAGEIACNSWQTLLMLAGILCIFLGVWLQKKIAWVSGLCMLAAVAVVDGAGLWQSRYQKRFVVYNIPAATALDFISGTGSYLAGDSVIWQNRALFMQHIVPAHTGWRIGTLQVVDSLPVVPVFTFGGKRIALVKRKLLFATANLPDEKVQKTAVDVLVLGSEAAAQVADLVRLFGCKQVVFDSSNPVWKIEKWKKACNGLHLRFHSVPQDGAFVMEL